MEEVSSSKREVDLVVEEAFYDLVEDQEEEVA